MVRVWEYEEQVVRAKKSLLYNGDKERGKKNKRRRSEALSCWYISNHVVEMCMNFGAFFWGHALRELFVRGKKKKLVNDNVKKTLENDC